MDIKSIVVNELTKQAEASVPELKSRINKYIIETVQSKEVEKEWATAINKAINLPGINERVEQEIFEKMVDKGTDIFANVMTKILEKK